MTYPNANAADDAKAKAEKEAKEKAAGGTMNKGASDGDITLEALQKSLSKLDALASTSPASRRDELMEKAKGEGLSTEERDELMKALGGEAAAPTTTVAETLAKSLNAEANTDLGDTIDGTAFLSELQKGFEAYAVALADRIEKSDRVRAEVEMVLVKAQSDIVKALIHQAGETATLRKALEEWGQQPQRGPKAESILHKGFGGAPAQQLAPGQAPAPPAGQLTKADVLNTLQTMSLEALEKGDKTKCALFGDALAGFEHCQGTLAKSVLDAVIQFRHARQNAQA